MLVRTYFALVRIGNTDCHKESVICVIPDKLRPAN